MWDIVRNNHEAIASKRDYELVQKLLRKDTRASPLSKNLYALSGLIECADCGYPMIRITIPSGGKQTSYYRCGNYKKNHLCIFHNINAVKLEAEVLNVINNRIKEIHLLMGKMDDSAVWQLVVSSQKK